MSAEAPLIRCAVLGSPIAHSLSPVLHRAAYQSLGLAWSYEAIDVNEAALADFLVGLGPEWRGLSLTMPLKTAVLPLLDVRSDLVLATGAANTVVLVDGARQGHNTDVPGLIDAITEAAAGRSLRTATILGAGATARSAVAALGGLGVGEVTVFARRPETAAALRATASAVGVAVSVEPWGRADEGLLADVVVATTPAGSTDVLALRVPHQPGVLHDVVYDPWPTALAGAWSNAGGIVVSGHELLLAQALRQVELMTGQRPEVNAMRAALNVELARNLG